MNEALRTLLIAGTDEDVASRYATLAQRAQEVEFGTIEAEYVVLDTETTGFDPHKDGLIEIAAAIMQGPHILDRFSTFVNPGMAISEFITQLTGISDDDVRDAPGPASAVEALQEFVGTRDVIAHNAPFDRSFVAANTAPGGSHLTSSATWIDTVELARIALPRLKVHNLEVLSAAFAPARSTHRAIDDVEALCTVWRVLLVALSDLPSGLPGFLAEMFPNTAWPLRETLRTVAMQEPTARFSLQDARDARARTLKTQFKVDALELDGGIAVLEALTHDELQLAYSREGLAGQMYAAYEPRGEQELMACEVASAYATNTHRAIEAGTGVGKSMAYLLPQALFAKRNRITCGVATKTNALLDQLVYHELPRLSQVLEPEGGLQYVALKGYDHYPCLRKLMNLASGDQASPGAATLVATLLTYVCQSAQGDLDPLPLRWSEVPRFEVCANADDCLHYKCRYHLRCLLHGARKAAHNADIVVTNHALLFCDVMADGGILPPIRHWVVDEAHSVEAEARRQLSVAVDARLFLTTLDTLLHTSGALSLMKRKALTLDGGNVLAGLIDNAQAEAKSLQAIAISFFSFVKDLCEIAEQSSYDRVDLWINAHVRESAPWGAVRSTGGSLASRLEKLWQVCRDIVSYCAQFPELLETQGDLAGLTGELKHVYTALALILDGEDSAYVYSAELDRRPTAQTDRLVAAQIDVGSVLLDRFYPTEKSVVFTSATIATGLQRERTKGARERDTSFDYFARSVGLDRLPPEQWDTLRLESSYDFEGNMTVYLPSDLPEPNRPGYLEALEQLLFEIHTALGGSVLTLFTNRREMEQLHARLKGPLDEAGITLRCQTRGTSAKRLRDEFLDNEQLSLFALRSFWEGFDAPGDTLRCVVIPKLPFGRPTDPLQQERGLRERDAWKKYVLPEAVIDLKQAAGRLIRSSTDHGSLVLADARLLTKWYGPSFLDALPSQRRHILATPAIAEHLRQANQG